MKQTRQVTETYFICDGKRHLLIAPKVSGKECNPLFTLTWGDTEYHFCGNDCFKEWVNERVEYSWDRDVT